MMPQLQTNGGTFWGRYWTETTVLRRYFEQDDNLAILSFGCSTGEELSTLRALFPNARLFGCDIDWLNLRMARSLMGADAVIFDSTAEQIRLHGPYDIIVCNSVLLSPTVKAGAKRSAISPSLWLDTVSMLDEALVQGGVLQVINTNIPFRMHPVARNYKVLDSPLILGPHFVDIFSLDGNILCSGVTGTGLSSILNRHLGEEAWSELEPGDLRHVHFRKGNGEIAPVLNEIVPNRTAQRSWASGSSTYRTALPTDPRPASYLEVDVQWDTAGTTAVRLKREVRRVWFDGTVAEAFNTEVDLIGDDAVTYIELVTGRRSSRADVISLRNDGRR